MVIRKQGKIDAKKIARKIIVKQILSDDEVKNLEGTKLPKGYYKNIIKNEDVDVYTEDGKMLLKFRKGYYHKKILIMLMML